VQVAISKSRFLSLGLGALEKETATEDRRYDVS
jgi:hypothetical protein